MTRFEELLKKNGVEEKTITDKQKIAILEAKVDALLKFDGLEVKEIGNNVFEVVKETEKPSGDYLNPIPFKDGDTVTKGLFYYTDDKDLPAEALKSGKATWNKEWFDIIG